MNRILFLILFSISIVFSNDNVVKTSQLELFLFKIGFQSLLKDVELTKDRSKLNEDELLTLNNKIDLIMDELYKSKRLIQSDKKEVVVKDESYKNEIKNLRSEIDFLKEEIKKLSLKNKPITNSKENKKAKVIASELNIRKEANNSSIIIGILKKGEIIDLDTCNSYGWCKLKNQKAYVASFLLDFNY